MKIGIIETGKPSATLLAKFGNYPDMFEALIGPHVANADFFTISVVSGEKLADPSSADGWVITGSRHGAYDDLNWISELEEFVLNCVSMQIPLVGVCFGHQIIAQAMDAKVDKSNKGWGVGPQSYSVINKPDWMTELEPEYTSHAVHQDQVLEKPAEATHIATSKFCKYAGFVYGNPDSPTAISVQSHPELSAEFVRDLGSERLSRVVPSDVLENGFKNLGAKVNNSDWGKTMAQFFQLRQNNRGF